jgi:serine protease AprX
MAHSRFTRRTYSIFLNIVNVLAVTSILGSSMSLGQTQILQAIEQPFNQIYTVDLDPQRSLRIISVTKIPSGNFSIDLLPKNPRVERRLEESPPKIHPYLEEWIKREVPEKRIGARVILHEDQKIPRLPYPIPGQPPTSTANQAIINARKALIDELSQRRRDSQARLIQRLHPHGLQVKEQCWLVNSLVVELPIRSVEVVAAQPEVLSIHPRSAEEPLFKDESALNSEAESQNDVMTARLQIQSDPYFDTVNPVSRIAVLDTGVLASHLLFQPSPFGVIRDCNWGDSLCERRPKPLPAFFYNPSDKCNHGTSTIGIIRGNDKLGGNYRGVTENVVDSLKVFRDWDCTAGLEAACRGFQTALALGAHIIVAELGAPHDAPKAQELARLADNAYDAGAIVIAPNGNKGPNQGTVATPAFAHKVIGVGAYDVVSGNTINEQSRGPTTDGRIKPDIQAPTNTETASNESDTALRVFIHTSGAAPYVGAAAALVRDWLVFPDNDFGPFDNGQVYAWLIASGQNPSLNNSDTEGAGRLKLLLGGFAHIGSVDITDKQTIDVPFATDPGDLRIDAAIWWPESASQEHNAIGIRILDPSGIEQASSLPTQSIFQRSRVDASPLVVGTWTLRIEGITISAGPQRTYFVVHHTPHNP